MPTDSSVVTVSAATVAGSILSPIAILLFLTTAMRPCRTLNAIKKTGSGGLYTYGGRADGETEDRTAEDPGPGGKGPESKDARPWVKRTFGIGRIARGIGRTVLVRMMENEVESEALSSCQQGRMAKTGRCFGKFPLAAGRRGVVDYPPFRRKVAGWPLKGGTAIVRELTGSVKRRMEADLPFHPRTTKL